VQEWLRLMVIADATGVLPKGYIEESIMYTKVVERIFCGVRKTAGEPVAVKDTIPTIGQEHAPSRRLASPAEERAMVEYILRLAFKRHLSSVQEHGSWRDADVDVVEGFGRNEGEGVPEGWIKPLLDRAGKDLAATMKASEVYRRVELEELRGLRTIRRDISLFPGAANKWSGGRRIMDEERTSMAMVAALTIQRACPYILSHGGQARDELDAAVRGAGWRVMQPSLGARAFAVEAEGDVRICSRLHADHPQNLRASNKRGGAEAAMLQGLHWLGVANAMFTGIAEPSKAGPDDEAPPPSTLLAWMEVEGSGFVGASHESNRDHLVRVHAAEKRAGRAVPWAETPGYVLAQLGSELDVHSMEDFVEKVVRGGFQYRTQAARESSIITPIGWALSSSGVSGGASGGLVGGEKAMCGGVTMIVDDDHDG
jgi:hypothetical protein